MSYGAFWLSWAYIVTPGTGVIAAYGSDETALNNALGMFLVTWLIFTCIMTVAAARTNVALFTIFCLTALLLLCLSVGACLPGLDCDRALVRRRYHAACPVDPLNRL